MDAILVDDTRVASIGTYGPALARDLTKISQLRLNRYSAVAWAQDLRFLVVDDGESVTPSQDSTEFGEETKSGGGIETTDTSNQGSRVDAGPDNNFNVTVIGREDTDSCETCQRYPVFSRRRPSTKYRIIQFPRHALKRGDTLCNHYVAISYCWQSDPAGAARARKGSYRVIVEEANGVTSERTNKAPDEIIDRAVEFANHIGTHLIWIDQECLPQDGSQEQELGIQAMDVVYQRAHWSAGLYQSRVSSQCELDAVASILDWGRQNRSTRTLRFPLDSDLDMGLFMKSLIDFLDMFCSDAWNQRAWILQELFSSSHHMTTVIRLHTPFVYRGSLELQEQAAAETLKMTGSEVDAFISASREFLAAGLSRARSLSPKDQGGEAFQRAHRIIKALETLRPEIAMAGNKYAYLYTVGKSSFGPRHRCNAAVALSYLRNRDNHRPADRLAIVANLCDYEIRLDTIAVEKSFRSLAVCLFTLAFVNGDLSLLVPEVYQLALIKGMFGLRTSGPSAY
jgi:Heterokaryon incompatibility protein (HET)